MIFRDTPTTSVCRCVCHPFIQSETKMKIEDFVKILPVGRIQIYLDASGSCATKELKDFFFTLADAFPSESTVELFSFDCQVYPVNKIDKKIFGLLGTNFDVIEENARQNYPDAICVITDGLGYPPKSDNPERWHWIIANPTPFSVFQGLPGNTYKFEDFE